MNKYSGASESLTPQEKKFCEVWIATNDVEAAMDESKVQIPFGRGKIPYGQEILRNTKIRDHVLMLSESDSNDMETCIKRLEVIRRQAWRKDDLKTVKDVEMQIASLRGWLVVRGEVKNTNLNVGASDMITQQFMAILSSEQGQAELQKQGLALVDGELKTIEADYERVQQ